jgi:hypothetical protein
MASVNEDARKKVASEIFRAVKASDDAKGELPKRWQRCEDMYHLVQGTCRMTVVNEQSAYEMPLLRPKVQRVVASMMDSLCKLYPFVQAITPGQVAETGEGADDRMEKALHELALSGGVIAAFKKAFLFACLTNLGIVRITPDDRKGCDFQWIHPAKIIVYPAEFGTFHEARTVGHRFRRMRSDIEQLQLSGKYMQGPIGQAPSDSPYEDHKHRADKTQQTNTISPDDDPIELVNVIHHTKAVNGKWGLYDCVLDIASQTLLKCEEYPYTQPNYFDFRFEETEGEIYTGDSLANALQGLQLAYSDTYTILIQGKLATAFPATYQIGAQGSLKTSSYGPGQIIQVPEGVKIQQIQSGMDLAGLFEILNGIENLASAVAGISQLGQTQEMKSGTTATAAAGFLQAQQEAKDDYSLAVCPAIERVWGFLLELYRDNPQGINEALGSRIEPLTPDDLAMQYVFEVTGKSGQSDPNTMIQKLMMLQQMAMNPASQLDQEKIEPRIVELLDLPFSTRDVMKSGPGRQQLLAIIAGVLSGQLSPEEAAHLAGINPQTMQALVMQHESEQGGSSPATQESGMATGQDGTGVPNQPAAPGDGISGRLAGLGPMPGQGASAQGIAG